MARTVMEHVPVMDFSSLSEVSRYLRRAASKKISKLEELEKVFLDNENRDSDDRNRYAELYEFDSFLDYRNKELYDIVVDTSLFCTAGNALGHALAHLKRYQIPSNSRASVTSKL